MRNAFVASHDLGGALKRKVSLPNRRGRVIPFR